jgi:hypothetical protein
MPVLASLVWRLPRSPRVAYGVCLFLTVAGIGAPPASAEPRTWKYLHEFSAEERQQVDLRTETPRDAALPYLPAEPYPFTPPYTAEEMGSRAMEFPHMARWNHVQIEDFASMTPTGYISNGKTIVLGLHVHPEGLEGYLDAKPGELFARWLSQDTAPPQNLGNQLLMLHHRTDVVEYADGFSVVLGPRRPRRPPLDGQGSGDL